MSDFHSILPISRRQIAYEKKIELHETLGGIPDQTIEKRFFALTSDLGACGGHVTDGDGGGLG